MTEIIDPATVRIRRARPSDGFVIADANGTLLYLFASRKEAENYIELDDWLNGEPEPAEKVFGTAPKTAPRRSGA